MASSNISTNRAGEAAVIAELQRRGVSSVEPIPGRRRELKVRHAGRESRVRVKARRAGSWQPSVTDGQPRTQEYRPTRFWVFVDLAERPAAFYVAPEWWVQNDIYNEHRAYLARHGGHRAQTEGSNHHSLEVGRIASWRDRWDLLGVM
jgi:hypothetical protein